MIKRLREGLGKIVASGTLSLAGALGIGCSSLEITPRVASLEPETKAKVSVSEILASSSGKSTRTDRAEVLVYGLPLDSQAYATAEKYSDGGKLLMGRLQSTPVGVDINGGLSDDGLEVRAGGSAQAVQFGNFPAHCESGPALSIRAKPFGGFMKSDWRFSPETDTLDTYTFLESGDWVFDVLGFYDVRSGSTSVRAGAGYNITDWLRIGPEAQFSGEKPGKMKSDYIGLAIKAIF